MTTRAKKISVCFINLKAYPIFNPDIKSVFGGAEVDLYLLATELAKDNSYDVSFVVHDYGQPAEEIIEGVRVIKSSPVDKNLFAHSPKIWTALKNADADIYMDESLTLGTTLYAMFCKLHKRKFVYRTASSIETDGTLIRKKPIRQLFTRWALKTADTLIVQNQTDQDQLQQRLRKDSLVIKNGCRILPLPHNDKSTVLWVARSAVLKRPDLFIQLAKQNPDYHFTMICPKASDDTDYEQTKQLAGKATNLIFIERVHLSKIDDYFAAARVFVNTSDYEGFPNTFVQACKNSTAILSLNVNPDDFLNRHDCGRCANGNWNVLEKTLSEMMTTNLGLELGQNGRQYIKDNHDLTVIIEMYKTIFKTLATG